VVTGVTLVGVLVAVVVALAAAIVGYWLVMAMLIRRGRRRRADRLSSHPDAYPPIDPRQDWHGRES
jgi:peptidoglycan/LPS O-acetylase OafA/YrhL